MSVAEVWRGRCHQPCKGIDNGARLVEVLKLLTLFRKSATQRGCTQ